MILSVSEHTAASPTSERSLPLSVEPGVTRDVRIHDCHLKTMHLLYHVFGMPPRGYGEKGAREHRARIFFYDLPKRSARVRPAAHTLETSDA
jgi:hypothetical protein